MKKQKKAATKMVPVVSIADEFDAAVEAEIRERVEAARPEIEEYVRTLVRGEIEAWLSGSVKSENRPASKKVVSKKAASKKVAAKKTMNTIERITAIPMPMAMPATEALAPKKRGRKPDSIPTKIVKMLDRRRFMAVSTMTPKDIKAGLPNVPPNAVEKAISSLAKRGLITRVDVGLYRAAA